MAKESISRIAAAEEEAENIESSAKLEKENILKEAEKTAEKILADAHAKSKEIIQSSRDNANLKAKEMQSKATRDAMAQADNLKHDVDIQRAVDLVIEKLVD